MALIEDFDKLARENLKNSDSANRDTEECIDIEIPPPYGDIPPEIPPLGGIMPPDTEDD